MADCFLRHLPEKRGIAQPDFEHNAHIFVIPGIEDEPVENWSRAHDVPLVRDLVKKGNPALNIQISVLEHQLRTTNFERWVDLDDRAQLLLGKLEEFADTWSTKRRPFLFLCHSLGGIILKRLLVHALRRRDEAAKVSFDTLAGIVLLGTPHLRESNRSEWANAAAILELRMPSPPRALWDEDELRQLLHWSRDFEKLGLGVRILSTKEEKKSKKQRISFQNNSVCIVGTDDLARTNASPAEDVVFVHADHNGLCTLTKDPTFRNELVEFCQKTLRITQDRLKSMSSTTTPCDPDRSGWASTDNIPSTEPDMSIITQHHTRATRQPANASPSKARPDDSIPGGIKLPCYLLDESVAVRDFVGREEVLREIDEYLLVKDGQEVMSTLKTVAISGMGGIGKTSIAYQYVKTRKEKFHAIFWVNADTTDKLNSSFGRIALELRLQDLEEDRDQVMSRKRVLQWLENPVMTYNHRDTSPPSRARWLLVFDNVDTFKLMRGFWPSKGAGSVLITSRQPYIDRVAKYSDTDDDSLTKRIPLKAFGEEEALEFLHKLTNKERTYDNEQAARKLAQRLGGFPLFLKQFAGIMNDGPSSFSDLLKMYSEESSHDRLYAEKPETDDDDYEHTIATVWSLEKLRPDARMVMNVLSFLDPDHIHEEIMTEGAPSIEIEDYPKNFTEYCRARDALWKRSLISTGMDGSRKLHDEVQASKHGFGTQDRLDEEGLDPKLEPNEEAHERSKPQLSVHRVLQDVSRSQMTEQQQREAFGIAVSLLLTRWNRKERVWNFVRKDWPRAEHLYSHVLQIIRHYEALKSESQGDVATVELVRLMNSAGWFAQQKGRIRKAKQILEAAEEVCTQHLNSDELLMLEIHASLGCVATVNNDPDTCYKHYKRLQEMTRERYPNPKGRMEYEVLMVSDNEMGVAEMLMDNIHDASSLFKKALSQAHRLRDDSEVAKSIYLLASANLGLAQWAEKKYENASNTLLQAWDYYEELIDAHENTGFAPGRIAHALGNVKDSQYHADAGSQKGEALEWYKRAYRDYEKTIGRYHHRSADVCHKLAEQYIALGDFDQAHYYIGHALKVFENAGDYYEPEQARTGNLQSILVRQEGNNEEADKIYERAKSLYEKYMTGRKKNNSKGRSPEVADFDENVPFWSR